MRRNTRAHACRVSGEYHRYRKDKNMIEVKAENYKALKEDLELVEIVEFSDLYERMERPMQKGFEKWLKKWGLL